MGEQTKEQTPQEFLEEYVNDLIADREIAAKKYCEAQPVYYGILTCQDFVTQNGYEDYDRYFFVDEPSGAGMTPREAFQWCWENELITPDVLEDLAYGEVSYEKLAESQGELPEDIENGDICEFLNEKVDDELTVMPLIRHAEIAPNAMFLTEKEAMEHFSANNYHYSHDAHLYCMTAWRNPRLAKFLELLTKIDFGKSDIVFTNGEVGA